MRFWALKALKKKWPAFPLHPALLKCALMEHYDKDRYQDPNNIT